MKTLKSLLAIAILTVVSYGVNAQIGASIGASADVLSALTLTKDADINFGVISKSTPGSILLSATGAGHQYTGADRIVGRFTIEGESDTDVQVLWESTVTLNHADNNNPDPITPLTLTLDVNGADNSANQLTSTDITSPYVANTNGTGFYYLWVGGSIPSIGSGAEAGLYSGTTTFTISYN